MTTYPVPAGQDGVTITVTSADPAVIHWPYAIPVQVTVAATGGAVRFGFRGSAASGASGLTTVTAGQSATVGTSVEANPLILHVATSAASASVTVTGYREPGVLISAPIPPRGGGSGGGSVSDATTTNKGVAVLLGGTASAPTVPWTSVTGAPSALTPADGSITDSKVATNAGISLDKTADGSTNRTFTTAEKSKLAAVAAGATANATNAELRDAATHTGQRTSASISDFTEAVQDAVAALLGAGSNVTINYDDTANTLTIGATASGGTGLDAEQVRDAIGVALVGVGNIGVVVNDAADTITITTTATANATDAQLRDRSTHTGQDPISAVTGLQTALDGKAATTDARFTDQRVPIDGSVTNAKVPANAAISLDKTADGTTNRVLTTAEKVKLATLEITGNVVHRLVEVNGVYPARPIAGYVDYFGTVNPGNLLQPGDTWTQVASQAPSATAPGAPTNVVATPENGQATISFLAPASNGGAAITSYTVTASPGGLTKTGSASPILFTGLTNGTAYTFTVKATNSAGTSASSAASSAVTPGTVSFLPGNLVADRNMRYGAFVTDSGGTYRTMQIARVPVSALTLTFGNWATLADPTGDTDNTNSYTIQKCYLEHGGTLTQVTFGGATSTSVPTGGSVRGTVTKTIAVGDTYYIRSYVTPDVSGGKYPTLSIGAKHYPGELSRKGADYANETGFANLNSLTDVFGPCAITGTVTSGTTKAVAVVGDSIAWGIGDSFSDSTRLGFIYRALNGNRAFLLFALPGESAQRFLTSRGDRRREYLGPAADYLICEHGVNDMQGSQTLAQCRANLLAVWSAALTRNPALKVYQTTLTPKSASTDSWATPENQTPDALVNSVRPSLNAWIRAGAPTVNGVGVNPGTSGALVAGQTGHPLKGYLEVADLAETARDSGKWKNGYTSDGVHPNATGHAALVPAIDLTVLV